MLKKNFALSVIFLLCGLHIGPTSAITLEVIPDKSTMNVSETLTTEVWIHGLGIGVAPSLHTFDFDLTFDPGLFALGAVTYGDQLNFDFPSLRSDQDLGAAVNVFEQSLDFVGTLNSLQADSFRLFSVEFAATSAGVGVFGLSVLSPLVYTNGFLPPALEIAATVEVLQPSAIPIPAAIWLFGTALIGLVGFGKRRKAA